MTDADLSAPARAGLETIDAGAEAMIDRVLGWSAINSGSFEPDGLARMAERLADAFAALPAPVRRKPLPPSERINADGAAQPIEHGDALWLEIRPDAPIQIALTGHYDTVFPAAHPFQRPWREDQDRRLRGPGVADMKGGLAVMLEALRAFEVHPERGRVGYKILLSPDEEIGSPASAALLAELGGVAHLGLVYEPALADGTLVDARKGSGNFAMVFRGRAAHVGRAFAQGRSAVLAAAEAALKLDALNAARTDVIVNIGAIDGGGPVNMVPPSAVLRLNARVDDPDAARWAQDAIAGVAQAASQREGIACALHGGFTRPAKPLTPAIQTLSAWAADAGAALGLELRFQPSGGVCEGNNLAAAGCANLDTMGPCGGGLHSDEEFALAASFAERAKLSYLILAGLAEGRFDPRALAP